MRPFPRFGLCCKFAEEPIVFRTTTAASMSRLPRAQQLRRLGELCLSNAEALQAALHYCSSNGIGCFRIASTLLPLRTHPEVGYEIEELPQGSSLVAQLRASGQLSAELNIRTTFHPDQFVVLNSPRADVVASSLLELEHHAEMAAWVGADVINIHAGGAYGNKPDALQRFVRALDRLSDQARALLTVENDDKVYSPVDLLPMCRASGLPLVYDVHHHRCLTDGMSVEQATGAALGTWNREPLFHVSSPVHGWGQQPWAPHHDYLDPEDFPTAWRSLEITVEVEAKAKELAIRRLREELVLHHCLTRSIA